jgi:hypothetical protein
MTMSNFEDFRNDVLNELFSRDITFSNVDFINLGASMWTTIDVFAKMNVSPNKKSCIQCTDCGSWSEVPIGFKVVLIDKRWLHYKQCKDPRDRKWELLCLPKRAPKYVGQDS